jgi:hypothetical protein
MTTSFPSAPERDMLGRLFHTPSESFEPCQPRDNFCFWWRHPWELVQLSRPRVWLHLACHGSIVWDCSPFSLRSVSCLIADRDGLTARSNIYGSYTSNKVGLESSFYSFTGIHFLVGQANTWRPLYSNFKLAALMTRTWTPKGPVTKKILQPITHVLNILPPSIQGSTPNIPINLALCHCSRPLTRCFRTACAISAASLI